MKYLKMFEGKELREEQIKEIIKLARESYITASETILGLETDIEYEYSEKEIINILNSTP